MSDPAYATISLQTGPAARTQKVNQAVAGTYMSIYMCVYAHNYIHSYVFVF